MQAGDEMALVSRDATGLKVADVTRLYTTHRGNAALLARAISVEALPERWRGYFQHLLEKLEHEGDRATRMNAG